MIKLGPIGLLALLLGGLSPLSRVLAQPSPDNELTLELLQRVEQLETEVRQLRGEMEVQRHLMETLARERPVPESPARSPEAAEPNPAPSPAAASPDHARAQPAAPAAAPPQTPGLEQPEFDAALGELREGRYSEAIAAWRRFLQNHPNGKLAGDAQYWLGESYYLNRNQNAAQEAFINLGLNHPQSPRLPDALLKLGYLYGEQGDTAQARNVLQKLVKVYPDTPAASLAERRLQSLR